jgi:hypothetical protein
MKIEGGCYCGEIRYQSTGAVAASAQCHCRECQYFTGGNANVCIAVPADEFRFTKGDPAEFTRGDLDAPVTRLFCATCGTAIGNHSPSRENAMIIKVGTLDDPSGFKAQFAIFTIDKQPFHHIDNDLPQFPRRPG